MGISVSMNCPKCGGALSVDEGSKTTTCPYCSLLLEIQGDDGVKKIMLTNNLDKDKAIAQVKGWWHGGFKARDLKNKGEITECYPIYVPFWKLKARVAGWVCGYNVVHENKTTKKVPKEVMINRDMDWNEVACDAGDIGVEHLHNLDGKAVLHDEGSIPTFEVTSSNTDALARGLESIRNSAIAMSGVANKTFQKVHVFPEGHGPDILSHMDHPLQVPGADVLCDRRRHHGQGALGPGAGRLHVAQPRDDRRHGRRRLRLLRGPLDRVDAWAPRARTA